MVLLRGLLPDDGRAVVEGERRGADALGCEVLAEDAAHFGGRFEGFLHAVAGGDNFFGDGPVEM